MKDDKSEDVREKSIIEKLGIFPGEFKVRMCIDDSGDYERRTYDILNCFPWGSNLITGDIDNPHHALLFATSIEMLNALLEHAYEVRGWLNKDSSIIKIIEKATGEPWNDIKAKIENEK